MNKKTISYERMYKYNQKKVRTFFRDAKFGAGNLNKLLTQTLDHYDAWGKIDYKNSNVFYLDSSKEIGFNDEEYLHLNEFIEIKEDATELEKISYIKHLVESHGDFYYILSVGSQYIDFVIEFFHDVDTYLEYFDDNKKVSYHIESYDFERAFL